MKTLRLLLLLALTACTLRAEETPGLQLSWKENKLTIRGPFTGGEIRVLYLEAYCRAGSTDADWRTHTTVGHRTDLLESAPDGKLLRLQCHVNDGLVVDHEIRAGADEVTFKLRVRNPTNHANEAEWAQPCVQLGNFAGAETDDPKCKDIKLSRSFIFLDGKLTRLPTQPWATEARYVPGQVWCPKHVPRTDVNPRPLSSLVPSNGVIGCFSKDEQWLCGIAFEPYQELFEGVIQCLHSDFRIGKIPPGGQREIRGKIYLMRNDVPAMLARFARDFPEQQPGQP
jgi:hypothetical protein